jgi:predicted RNA-binding Zn-ribbon protein involved in translation (DUF1610 family)
MAAPAQDNVLNCTQCGGELHPDEGQVFLVCPFCGATVYLDKSRVVFHWFVAPTLDEKEARGALFRWMSGNQTVKDLDQKSQVTGVEFRFFPIWYIRLQAGGREEVGLQPAAATAISELTRLNLPAGDLQKYDPKLDSQSDAPTVPLQAALDWFHQKHQAGEVREISLVHVPIFIYKYQYAGKTFTAVVDGASGTVLANLFPAKAEVPYQLVGGVAAIVFLCLAVIPVFAAISGGSNAAMTGILICGGLGVIAAPLLMIWALWVASKV